MTLYVFPFHAVELLGAVVRDWGFLVLTLSLAAIHHRLTQDD